MEYEQNSQSDENFRTQVKIARTLAALAFLATTRLAKRRPQALSVDHLFVWWSIGDRQLIFYRTRLLRAVTSCARTGRQNLRLVERGLELRMPEDTAIVKSMLLHGILDSIARTASINASAAGESFRPFLYTKP